MNFRSEDLLLFYRHFDTPIYLNYQLLIDTANYGKLITICSNKNELNSICTISTKLHLHEFPKSKLYSLWKLENKIDFFDLEDKLNFSTTGLERHENQMWIIWRIQFFFSDRDGNLLYETTYLMEGIINPTEE